ncbi:tyrosine-protein kinase STYK1b [Lepisosteus oculatus]|uniref:tyrosine-protein kinase STYK1b n=1 Tax=Lepisosteus oculatus TaxID=7918 RepID=UPI0037242F35
MSSLSEADDQCKPGDAICNIRVYEQEVIIVPVLLLASFLVTFVFILLMKYCPERVDRLRPQGGLSHRSRPRSRATLRGIEAPPGLDPLENEYIALGGYSSPVSPPPASDSASSSAASQLTELPAQRLPESFHEISALPLSFCLKTSLVSLYRARMDNRDVVLRVLKDSASPSESHNFIEFARFLSRLGKHPNLVELLGVVSLRVPLITVTEELEHRDLLGFLWRCRQDNLSLDKPCDLTEKRLFIMARQVASALEFLHNKGYLHGNVAAHSILIGGDLTAKLWGLGTSFRASMKGAMPTGDEAGLRKWQAPERLAKRPASTSSDVWSFGILLFEMITLGDPPFPEVPVSELLQFLQRDKTLKKPVNCSSSLYSIMKSCCQWRQQDRPQLAEVLRRLQSGEKQANDRTVLRVPEPISISKYLREAGYGDSDNYTVF